MDGLIVKINRPNSEIDNHISELGVEDIELKFIDNIIINDSTLEDLYQKIEKIIK